MARLVLGTTDGPFTPMLSYYIHCSEQEPKKGPTRGRVLVRDGSVFVGFVLLSVVSDNEKKRI